MRTCNRLVRNGNSTQITLPKPMLVYLGWLAGESVIVELREDRTLVLRRPEAADFVVRGALPLTLPFSVIQR